MADVDLLIIGAGPAGLAAATSARRAGATVRVLEASGESGGSSGGTSLLPGPPVTSSGCTTNGGATSSSGRPSAPTPGWR